MMLLLDTHLLLWWLSDDRALSQAARTLIRDPSNRVFVSAVSAWEIAIKQSLGKLKAPGNLEEALAANHFRPLPITVSHALEAGGLDPHHTDPFDRMLVAQARLEGMTLATHDRNLRAYGQFVQVV